MRAMHRSHMPSFHDFFANFTPSTGLNEYYSGFDNIGHNDLMQLIFLWIIPK